MNTFIIFDNSGKTLDRFTVINKDTGDVFGASSNPDAPNGVWTFCGNCANQHIAFSGAGWRQKLPGIKVIKAAVDKLIFNAKFDPDWIGNWVDFDDLPETLQQYLSNKKSGKDLHESSRAHVLYMAMISGEGKARAQLP